MVRRALLYTIPLLLAAVPAGTKGIYTQFRDGAEVQPSGPALAVVYGVNNFEGLADDGDLPHGVTDADLVASALKDVLESTAQVSRVPGTSSTKEVKRAILAPLEAATADTTVLLYLHTHAVVSQGQVYLLTRESILDSRVAMTALPLRVLRDALEATRAKRVVVYADVVHQALPAPSGWSTGPRSGVEAHLQRLAELGSKIEVVVSREDAVAAGPCAGRGLYACALVSALGGGDGNGDRVVSQTELTSAMASIYDRASPATLAPVYAAGPVASTAVATSAALPVSAWAASTISTGPIGARPPRVRVCLERNGRAVGFREPFHTGDVLTLRTTFPSTGHVYIVNVGPGNTGVLLFPWEGRDNVVPAGSEVRIFPPGHDPVFRFDTYTGLEQVYVVWSRESMGDGQAIVSALSRRGLGASPAESVQHAGRVAGMKGITLSSPGLPSTADLCQDIEPDGTASAWVLDFSLDHLP